MEHRVLTVSQQETRGPVLGTRTGRLWPGQILLFLVWVNCLTSLNLSLASYKVMKHPL